MVPQPKPFIAKKQCASYMQLPNIFSQRANCPVERLDHAIVHWMRASLCQRHLRGLLQLVVLPSCSLSRQRSWECAVVRAVAESRFFGRREKKFANIAKTHTYHKAGSGLIPLNPGVMRRPCCLLARNKSTISSNLEVFRKFMIDYLMLI